MTLATAFATPIGREAADHKVRGEALDVVPRALRGIRAAAAGARSPWVLRLLSLRVCAVHGGAIILAVSQP